MSEDWQWWWGKHAEAERYNGPFATREEAVAEAMEESESGEEFPCFTVCEATKAALRDDVFDADWALEQWHDRNEEAQDEDGELGMSPTNEQRAELEQVLTAAFAGWRQKHHLGRAWAFGEIRNTEIIQARGANVAPP
jgi:hypothetical protein